MEFEQTRTYANLMAAYAGESQARVKYEYYEQKARKDGLEQIANIFKETSYNEKAHAYIWFKLLHGGNIQTTDINLQDAATGEHFEWTDMYKKFEKEAREEKFDNIAELFAKVAKIEKEHEERYQKLYDNIEDNLVFEKKAEKTWKCLNCGHIHYGTTAPKGCPVCSHPQAYFEIECQNY
ncbi:MAG: rubrerythrin family protein [Clostridia bacterium]